MTMSNKWQVYKFGGTSLATPGRLPMVIDRVISAPGPVAVVVSALGDSTDWLTLAAHSAAEGNIGQARRELNQVRDLAIATARDLALIVHPHPTLSETLMEAAEMFYGHATHAIAKKRAAH